MKEKPSVCPLCAVKLIRFNGGSGGYYYLHQPAHGCLLTNLLFPATPENVEKWNRRVGKPLWATKPEDPE